MSSLPAWSATLYTTFGPGDSYDTLSGINWSVGSPTGVTAQEVAATFVAGFTGTLDSIRVAALHLNGPNSFTVSIATDNSGQPGTVLESFTGVTFTTVSSIVTLISGSNPLLSTGSTYWVGMTPTSLFASQAGWNVNNQGIGGTYRRFNGADPWFLSDINVGPTPAFEVNTTSNGVIPEPSTAGLTLAGLAGLALLARRRRNRRAA